MITFTIALGIIMALTSYTMLSDRPFWIPTGDKDFKNEVYTRNFLVPVSILLCANFLIYYYFSLDSVFAYYDRSFCLASSFIMIPILLNLTKDWIKDSFTSSLDRNGKSLISAILLALFTTVILFISYTYTDGMIDATIKFGFLGVIIYQIAKMYTRASLSFISYILAGIIWFQFF